MKITIPICPICQKRNVPPAHITGHANAGTKKTLSPEGLRQRKNASKMPRKKIAREVPTVKFWNATV